MINNRVLIIDDDEEMCEELQEILEDEGYEVCVALNGRKGYEFIKSERYVVVILDLKLPELNGYEVLKMAKSHDQALKIIVLSGRPSGEKALHQKTNAELEEDKILQLADFVMNKPVLVPELINKVKEFIQ